MHLECVTFQVHQGHLCHNQHHIQQHDVTSLNVPVMSPNKRAACGFWEVILPETSKGEVLEACI